jgi:hypothetical protein
MSAWVNANYPGINKTAGRLSAPVVLKHFTPTGVAQGWRYSAAKLTAIMHLADLPVTGSRFTASCPATSITL